MRFMPFAFLTLVLLSSCGDSTSDKTSPDNEHQPEIDSTTAETAEKFILQDLLTLDSEKAVIDSFGQENVKHALAWYPEGMGQYQTTYLFPDTKNQVQFVWKDDSLKFTGLQYIELWGDSTDWKTSSGITFGTDLHKLEEINGAPFEFYGFGWDYGGAMRESDGKLKEENVYLTLDYDGGNLSEDLEAKLIGDQVVKSNSPEAQQANPNVLRIRILK